MLEYRNEPKIFEVREQLDLLGLPRLTNDSVVQKTKRLWVENQNQFNENPIEVSDYGTFKDSLRAPIHRWFKYPAGYSYKFVQSKIFQYQMKRGRLILDPFVGSGTTSLEAKRHRIHSIGVEAHPFVHWVATVKTNWELQIEAVIETFQNVLDDLKKNQDVRIDDLPELVRKCYSDHNLRKLVSIRNSIQNQKVPREITDFLLLGLTDTLRNASRAATGWPYISPKKMHQKAIEKDAIIEFQIQVRKMIEDLEFFQSHYRYDSVLCNLIKGDSRTELPIQENSVDLALTSPPYLNNFDYADRTRLETYFFEWYQTWKDITQNVRDILMMSATTQVRRNERDVEDLIDEDIKKANRDFYILLKKKVVELSKIRLNKGGKKSYDYMVAGYMNDMFKVLYQVYRVLKTNADFLLVLGDSAPYGVYIPTHEFLSEMAKGIGYSGSKIEVLRKRGEKWKDNPQRHGVKLKEVVLTLTK